MKRCSLIFILVILTCLLSACDNNSVPTITPRVGVMTQSFTEIAKTKLSSSYLLFMPISGELNAFDTSLGAKFKEGQVVVALKQRPLMLALDAAKAKYQSIQKILQASIVEANALKLKRGLAMRDLNRNKGLAEKDFVSKAALDHLQTEADTAQDAFAKQVKTTHAVRAYMASTKAEYGQAQYNLNMSKIKAPINGILLTRKTRGSTWLAAGTIIGAIGAKPTLEGVAEVLTTDAQQLKLGDTVEISLNDQAYITTGKVTEIDPQAFTKRSPLGVDEQRVNVTFSINNKARLNLGVGYRLYARFITQTIPGALLVPRASVLQTKSGHYYVMLKQDGDIKQEFITIGAMNDRSVVVKQGLTSKNHIIEYPENTV